MLLLLLGFCALLLDPSLQMKDVLGKGEACGGTYMGRCGSNLTCVVTEGTGDKDWPAEGICTLGPAPGCAPCSSVVCPREKRKCRGSHLEMNPCGCCPQCARQNGELCGGRHWEKGYCDRGLTCMLVQGFGPALAPNTGVCKVLLGKRQDYLNDPLCPMVWGCSVRVGLCDCFNTQTCHDAYSYSNYESCREVQKADYRYDPERDAVDDLQRWLSCTKWGCELREDRCECLQRSCSSNTHQLSSEECEDLLEKARCRNASCPEAPTPSCPPDSFLTEPYTSPGQCCPLVAAMCTCSLEKCPLAPPTCPPGQHSQLREGGNGHPGSCCDQYQCLE